MSYGVNPGETLSPKEFKKIEKLLMAHRRGKWNKPLAVDELLEIGREAFEPLFHVPPLGPIPEHLRPHMSVHGCVAEYEEQFEELERWKVKKLELWLKDNLGNKFTAGEDVYELSLERGKPSAPDKYWLKRVSERSRETRRKKWRKQNQVTE
jgi:hypothetical protein